jgi:hypothetical protein
MSMDRHHWRELILKSGPNTEAREELISKMAERLDKLESFYEDFLVANDRIMKISEPVLSEWKAAKRRVAKR